MNKWFGRARSCVANNGETKAVELGDPKVLLWKDDDPPASFAPPEDDPCARLDPLTPTRRTSDGSHSVIESEQSHQKAIILIRHGTSAWNEFLGASKNSNSSASKSSNSSASKNSNSNSADGRFKMWSNIRAAGHHAKSAMTNVGALQSVDHGLTKAGLNQARRLRADIANVVESKEFNILTGCTEWYVSPLLRALQTAAYALSPLVESKEIHVIVSPDAAELHIHRMALDCKGVKGNVGSRLVARAIRSTAEVIEEEEPEIAGPGLAARLEELAIISRTFCTFDLSEVQRDWCEDIGGKVNRKARRRAEEARVRRLFRRLVMDSAPVVGLIAHSQLFRCMIQLLWPLDESRQEAVRVGMRNGAPDQGSDPYTDKIMNCGVLVVKVRYDDYSNDATKENASEITGAEFLFGGHMERGSSRDIEYFYSDEEDEDEVEDNNGFDSGHDEFESMTTDPQ